MSKLAITTISIALLTASGFAHANGHEDPQAAIEKLKQEKSVLLKRLNNAVAYSKSRGEQIVALQAKADGEAERRTALGSRLNNANAFSKTSMDEANALRAKNKALSKRLNNAIAFSKGRSEQLEAEQAKNEAMSTGISSALAVSKKRSTRLAEAQALAESEQSKNKALSKRLRNAVAFSKTRGKQLASAQKSNKQLGNRLRNSIAFSKTRGMQLASAQKSNKQLGNRLRNSIAFSKTRRMQLASAQKSNKQVSKRLRNAIAYSKSRANEQAHGQAGAGGDWTANTSAALGAAVGGLQGTTVSSTADDSVIVQVGNNGLFRTGGTILSADGRQLLGSIAQEISATDASITVVGHTDSIPVGNSSKFSSNEALSFARAVSTLQFLREQGVAKERLSAAGYGADNPVAGNDTPEGRQQNRRVEIVLRKQ